MIHREAFATGKLSEEIDGTLKQVIQAENFIKSRSMKARSSACCLYLSNNFLIVYELSNEIHLFLITENLIFAALFVDKHLLFNLPF